MCCNRTLASLSWLPDTSTSVKRGAEKEGMSLVFASALLHCSGFAKLLNALDIKLVKVVKYNLVEMPQGSVVEGPQMFYKRPVSA